MLNEVRYFLQTAVCLSFFLALFGISFDVSFCLPLIISAANKEPSFSC